MKDDTWDVIHDRLRAWIRVSEGREESPSEVILDSQEGPRLIHTWVCHDDRLKITDILAENPRTCR